MNDTVRHVWFLIRRWLQSDSVIPFVWVYYLWLFAFGVTAVLVLEPGGAVDRQLGRGWYTAWSWTCILGTAAVILGLVLRHGGTAVEDMTTRQKRSDWLGLWMQWSGHAGMFFALLAFETAGLSDSKQLSEPFVLFAIAPYVQGCLILWLTTSMKLLKARRL